MTVLIADGTLHASNGFESEEIDATKATRRVKAVAAGHHGDRAGSYEQGDRVGVLRERKQRQ